MSTDLQWLLLRKWNSFTHHGGNGTTFSREKGNLMNAHSHKYSGLANSKVGHPYYTISPELLPCTLLYYYADMGSVGT